MWRPGETILELYEVLDVIRTGGMGLVYRVRHHGWGVDLAVKTPRSDLVASASGRELFQAEAESWVSLGLHPNIVSCAYVRRVDRTPAVFAEWVDGGSLADAVRTGRLYEGGPDRALRRILDVAVQFAWGLEHAHRHDMVHQDVKPANVMLTTDGSAKVTDFGLAKARVLAGEPAEAPAGASVLVTYGGMTPAYCSPEQASGGRVQLSRATDVWSWALSVLEMFVGGMPTPYGAAGADVLEAFLGDPAPAGPPGAVPPPMPDDLVPVLRQCFLPDPAARPRMAELAERLAAVHAAALDEPYPRAAPSPATLRADGLSNRALSMLDLGYPDQAETLWEQALRVDPHHPHTVHNRGLHRWRTGRQTDAHLLAELTEVGADRSVAAVDRERGDPVASIVLRGHQRWVGSVALTPDGRLAATGGEENTSPTPAGSEGGAVRVWDVASGRCLHRLDGHPRRSTALAFSGDGRLLASGGDDRTVLIWETATGQCRHRLAHPSEIRSLALTGDGGLLVADTLGGSVLVWDTAGGRLVHTLQQEQRGPSDRGGVTFSADGRHVIKWSQSMYRMRVWDTATGGLVRSGPLPDRPAVLLTPSVAVVVDGERVEHVDPVTGRPVRHRPKPPDWAGPAAVDTTGRWGLAKAGDTVEVWDLTAGRCLRTLPGHDGWVQAVALDAAGRIGLSGGADGAARLWRLTPPGPPAPWSYARPRAATELNRAADLVGAALDRADRSAAAGDLERAATELRTARAVPGHERDRRIVDRWAALGRSGRRTGLLGAWPVRQLPGSGRTQLSPDGRLAALRSGNSMPPQIWDLSTGERLHTLTGHGDATTDLAFTPDSRYAVTGGHDHTVRIWDLVTGQCRHVLTGHRGQVSAVAVGADGRFAVSGGGDGTVRLWDVAHGRQVRVLHPHEGWVLAVELTGTGREALALLSTGGVCVLDTTTGQCVRAMPGKANGRESVAVSLDGRTGLAPSLEGSALWQIDLTTGELGGLMYGHTAQITAVAVDAGGRTAHSGSADRTIRVWDLVTGQCRHVLTGHTGVVTSLAPTADGRFTLSAADDGTVRVWDLHAGRCLQVLQGPAGDGIAVELSADGRTALASSRTDETRVWELDWDYAFQPHDGWDEAARPWLVTYGADEDLLLARLRDAGLGGAGRTAVRAAAAAVTPAGPARTSIDHPAGPAWSRLVGRLQRKGKQQ
ncbi:protein kinase [Dactylosporangium fulvum]|uniref:Protein kinase n=1 Tax=Dactylosporangium fulvum TaxID=53359 RepID=A0ABY5VMJ2_9ACTN|nr:protein kinase [Dactylosporangium fulvum]UWP78907.1 protein kinase [Dactylosporangium fulvum]